MLERERNHCDWRVGGQARPGSQMGLWLIPEEASLSFHEEGLGDLPQNPVWVSVGGTLMLQKAR